MSGPNGPKHLWSGDWESESAQPASAPPRTDEPAPEPQPEPPARRRWSRHQILIALYAGVAAAAVTVALVTTLDGSAKPKPKPQTHAAATNGSARHSGGNGLTTPTLTTPTLTTPTLTTPTLTTPTLTTPTQTAPTQTAPTQSCTRSNTCTRAATTPVVSGPSTNWLGMQIITSPAGVVINALKPGSPADQAGFEPGDQIQEVDSHQINSVAQLRTSTNGLKLGAPVTIDVLRGSVMVKGEPIAMTQRPKIRP